MAAEMAAGGTGTRRNALMFAGWGTIALVGLQAVVAFIVFFWPRKLGAFGGKLSAGNASDYKVGDVKYFVDGKFYISRVDEGLLALYQKCVHLGCTVPWRPDFEFNGIKGWFRCPCHGSTYDHTGQIVFGPAPRPLDYMKMTVDGGKITVDTGAIQKRERWEPSQATKV